MSQPENRQRFTTTVGARSDGGAQLAVPFDPDVVWGAKPRHLVAGTLGGFSWRGEVIKAEGGGHALVVGPAACRDITVPDGIEVEVVLAPEGPQRGDLDPDVAAALAADPVAGAFFDGLAQFYRKAYLTWIAGTKRRPEERVRRIAEVTRLLHAGEKTRPQRSPRPEDQS